MSLTGDTIHYIGDGALYLNQSMDFDTREITYIGDGAFFNNIKSLKIDGPLEYIGKQAFRSCDALTEVSIHSTKALTVGDEAFFGCSKLSFFSITSDVSLMLGEEILNCTTITSVELSKSTVIRGDVLRRYAWGVALDIIWK